MANTGPYIAYGVILAGIMVLCVWSQHWRNVRKRRLAASQADNVQDNTVSPYGLESGANTAHERDGQQLAQPSRVYIAPSSRQQQDENNPEWLPPYQPPLQSSKKEPPPYTPPFSNQNS
ncbi:hypothetical protein GGI25_001663 [Coemansia spiralis]|uniref:Uncharacterized protein n=2 Tax=Coemansia TaxID=4863 RepID=A0A9W8KYA4_9FUNG|nr:hypothetical protein EDC05_005489 [Coemansia umbellata]KAJ2623905.1 hypothetical protein GGI26_001920 [Coemansia sp. RSA 1358]KAJ2679307.1 hypothetical protein GGI25_001663 [Coemansia spiralis]